MAPEVAETGGEYLSPTIGAIPCFINGQFVVVNFWRLVKVIVT